MGYPTTNIKITRHMSTTIGLLFGSFNPVHIGHLALANYLAEYAGLDEVWFVLTPKNPFKEKGDLLDEAHRLELLKLALQEEPRFKASDFEFMLPRPSFTIDTLDKLHATFPQHDFRLIMGADNLLAIDKWKEPERLLKQYRLLIYPRPGYSLEAQPQTKGLQVVDAPLLDLSATLIREGLRMGKNLRYLLPHGVYDLITARGWYK